MPDEERQIRELSKKWFEKVEVELAKQIEKAMGKPAFRDILIRFENRYYFLMGLGFGVLFGILGNFTATHWVELLRLLVVNEKDWWLINGCAFSLSVSALLLCGLWINRRIRSEREMINRAWLETLREAVKEVWIPPPEELKQLLAKRQRKLSTRLQSEDKQD